MPDTATKTQLLLGFDFGLKQIGVAVAETVTATPRPLTIITAREGQPSWDTVASLFDEWQPDYLVVGLPLNMDGSESEMSARARKFAARLHGRFGYRVELHDERLTSREAKAALKNSDEYAQSWGGKAAESDKVDALAAAIILQSWLQSQPNAE